MKLRLVVASILVMFAACSKSKSNPEKPKEPEAEMPGATPDPSPALIGGRPADPKDWPASVYASMNGARCTATVVGPQVLIIASHCVSHGGSASFSIGPNSYGSTCSRSPLYRQGIDHDLTLCKIDKPVTGIEFEVLNQDENLIEEGREILLTGYGCLRPGGGGGNDGIYRIGEATIQRGSNPYDFVAKGRAALCFGDSGGPAFLYLDAAKTKRVQVSVNSKGDIRTTSYLTSVSSDASKKFIKEWSDSKGVKICGVHEDLEGCRGIAVEPPKPPQPPPPQKECGKLYDSLKACIKEDVVDLK